MFHSKLCKFLLLIIIIPSVVSENKEDEKDSHDSKIIKNMEDEETITNSVKETEAESVESNKDVETQTTKVSNEDDTESISPDLDHDNELLERENKLDDVLSESSIPEPDTEDASADLGDRETSDNPIEQPLHSNTDSGGVNTESKENIFKEDSEQTKIVETEELNIKSGEHFETVNKETMDIKNEPNVNHKDIEKDDISQKKNPETVSQESEELGGLYNEGKTLYTENKKRGLKTLLSAAERGHPKAIEDVIYPLIFGDDVKVNISKSFEYLQILAENGNPKGQQGLGFLFGTGLHGNSSQAKAIIYTTFAALGGDTMAEMMLGYRHYSGIGVAKSCETALTYYKKVAKKVSDAASSYSGGNAVQRIRLYDELEQPGGNSGQIDEDLLQYYQFLADKGDTQAQVGLGQLYFQGGRGVDVNFEKAFYYFHKASENGNGNGLAYIGKMYMQGLFVDKDPQLAHDYFQKSLESKNPIGQAGLGMLYLKGDGVPKDYDKALTYFSQSAEQGWVEGQLQLGNMYYNGIGVKKDFRQAVKYFTFASQSGHVLAFYNLAMMHTIGAGVMRSCNAATELFKNVAERGRWSMMFMDAYEAYKKGDIKKALFKYYFLAELGYEIAQSNVAYILDKDEVSFFEKNETYSRALLQWSRAAEQGYSIARVKVGDYYFYGLGTKVNYEMAALQYRLASDKQANAQAMFNLGYMHGQGFGLKKDIYLAKRFYDMAAEASPDAQFPVYLALIKLAFEFSIDWLGKNYRFWERIDSEKIQLYVAQRVGPDWDIYFITLLTGLLGLILLFRRQIRR